MQILLFGALALVVLGGCGEAEEPDGSEWSGTGGLEFDIESASMQTMTINGSCAGKQGHFRIDSGSIYGNASLASENAGVVGRDVYTPHPQPIAPGTELCIETGFVGGEWSPEECLTIENESYPVQFTQFVSEGACEYYLSVPVRVDRFEPRAYCESTCGFNAACNRSVEGDCYEDCMDLIEGSPGDEATSCHYAIRDAYECMYWSSCGNKSGFEDRCLVQLANAAFGEPRCDAPEIPVGVPDPRACDPTPTDLVAGTVGDFARISITTDFPGHYYFVLDLTQLAEIDAAIAENPGSASLQFAAAVSRDLKRMDQGADDMCDQPDTLAILFDPPFDPSALGSIDMHIRNLQVLIDQLDNLAEAARQAVVNEIMSLYCDGLTEIFGDVLGYLVQVQQGCWDSE
jgi:hypothetical protein